MELVPPAQASFRQVTWKDVTVNDGSSAGGRGTPKAEAQCGGGAGTGTHVTCGVERLDSV